MAVAANAGRLEGGKAMIRDRGKRGRGKKGHKGGRKRR
jgi:hypothetical protein